MDVYRKKDSVHVRIKNFTNLDVVDNKPSFVSTRIIYLEHELLRVSSFL